MDDYIWDPRAEPDAEIVKLEEALRPLRFEPRQLDVPTTRRRTFVPYATAAAAAVVCMIGGSLIYLEATEPAAWSIETIAGSPSLSGKPVGSTDRLTNDEVLETDSRSIGRLAIGTIGVADIAPGSRVRLVRADAGEHRLLLSHGTIHARIWAKPRFFVVETPAGTATDLGCIYTLAVDSLGHGSLAVSEGEVELVDRGLRTLVVAGNGADLKSDHGPGLPYPLRSSAEFRSAVLAADAAGYDSASTERVLQKATRSEGITLWHLLARTAPDDRSRVYSTLAKLDPPPAGVTAAGIASLDQEMLDSWGQAMRDSWNSEPKSWWRNLLLRVGLRKAAVRISGATPRDFQVSYALSGRE